MNRPDQAADVGFSQRLAQCRPVDVHRVAHLHAHLPDGRKEDGGPVVGVGPIG